MTKVYCLIKDCPHYKKVRGFANRGICSCKELFKTIGDDEMGQVTGYNSYCPYSTVEWKGE